MIVGIMSSPSVALIDYLLDLIKEVAKFDVDVYPP